MVCFLGTQVVHAAKLEAAVSRARRSAEKAGLFLNPRTSCTLDRNLLLNDTFRLANLASMPSRSPRRCNG